MDRFRSVLSLLGLFTALVAGAGPAAAGEPCAPEWVPTFGEAPGFDAEVLDVCEFDDGSGAGLQIYAAGRFSTAGATAASRIARWDGAEWKALDSGIYSGSANALAVFDDGTGAALYAAGEFQTAGGRMARNLAKWDGNAWSQVGGGVSGVVNDMLVFDDGSGPALFLAGSFIGAGNVSAYRVVKWDGHAWSPLGAGLSGAAGGSQAVAYTLEAHADEGGTALFVGGSFRFAGGVAVQGVARWDGQSWASLPGEPGGVVRALRSVPERNGGPPVGLYAGGSFGLTGDDQYILAFWHEDVWTPVLGLGASASGSQPDVRTMLFDEESVLGEPSLLVGGAFAVQDDPLAQGIARWNGAEWTPLEGGVAGGLFRSVNALLHATSSGSIVVGGDFEGLAGVPALRIAEWRDESFHSFGSGFDGAVRALTVLPSLDGSRAKVAVAGVFDSAGAQGTGGIAIWDGTGWESLAAGANGAVYATLYQPADDGSFGTLFIGGDFTRVGGVDACGVAAWDGASWSALGDGICSRVYTLGFFDDGVGSALYAGGSFAAAGSAPAANIAKWDGAAWSAVGQGTDSAVVAMKVYDDGSGPALYVGGNFVVAGGMTVNRIAKWDGMNWSSLGSGLTAVSNSAVYALEVFDDGSGASLYAGGLFTRSGEQQLNYIARWDGQNWAPLGQGVNWVVYALSSLMDADGPALYAGGSFTSVEGRPAGHGARWDGASWRGFTPGIGGTINALAGVWHHEDEPAWLYVGGEFVISQPGDSFLVRQRCFDPAPLCNGDANGDFVINMTDLNFVLVTFGRTGADLPADLNGDGSVNFADLNEVLSNFGVSCR